MHAVAYGGEGGKGTTAPGDTWGRYFGRAQSTVKNEIFTAGAAIGGILGGAAEMVPKTKVLVRQRRKNN